MALGWQLEHAGHIENYEMLEELGEKTPLRDMPEPDADVSFFLQAFSILSRSRGGGMGPSPILLSEIGYYWEHVAQIGPLDEFIAIMQELDSVYLDHAREQTEQQRASKH